MEGALVINIWNEYPCKRKHMLTKITLPLAPL